MLGQRVGEAWLPGPSPNARVFPVGLFRPLPVASAETNIVGANAAAGGDMRTGGGVRELVFFGRLECFEEGLFGVWST